jgi:hypothetical protein
MKKTWTEDMNKTLKALRDKGLSYKKISEAMEMTKGAIAGQIYRLGLAEKGGGPFKKPPIIEEVTRYTGTVQLRDGCCRWPLWEMATEPHTYCMKPSGLRMYCPQHSRIAYQRPKERAA